MTTYVEALEAEVRILIRAVATDPTKRLSKVTVAWIDAAGRDCMLDYPRIVQKIAEKPTPLPKSPTPAELAAAQQEMLGRIGLLQAIRDELTQLTAPATGLSVSYTALVTGDQRGSDPDSIVALANRAYGGLSWPATLHRWMMLLLAIFSLLIAMFAAWEATKASVGKSLLQVLDPLRVQQTAVASDKYKLEVLIEKTLEAAKPGMDARYLPVCDRHRLTESGINAAWVSEQKLVLHTTPEIREVCGRDLILSQNFAVAHEGLRRYLEFWPDVAGGPYSFFGHIAAAVFEGWRMPGRKAACTAGAKGCDPGVGGPCSSSGAEAACGDIEFKVAPIVQVLSSFVLPFIFGVLGSFMYVLLHYYGNLKANTLIPRDLALGLLRIVLGVVVAASISLLITSYAGPSGTFLPSTSGSAAPGALIGSLTLSASAVTLLAGFGAEAVFTLLQTLVERVFALPK